MHNSSIMTELHAWFLSLPPDFVFLLALPFLVAFAGLLRVQFADPGSLRTTERRQGHPGDMDGLQDIRKQLS